MSPKVYFLFKHDDEGFGPSQSIEWTTLVQPICWVAPLFKPMATQTKRPIDNKIIQVLGQPEPYRLF